MKNKVVVLGFDGADFGLIEAWVKEGKLPNFAKLMKDGVWGRLKSTPDAMSPSAWTSFATGKNPGKHGIYNFMDFVPGSLKLRYYDSTYRDSQTIWTLANSSNKRSIVLNVPMTFPADKINGIMVSGWTAPSIKSEGFTFPPELINSLLKKYGEFVLFPTVKKHIYEGHPGLGINNLYKDLDMKRKISQDFLEKEEWDLFVSFFIHTDQVQHYYWHFMDKRHPRFSQEKSEKYSKAIINIYAECDKILGEHLKDLGDDVTVIIMSDHGHGPNHQAVQYLPLWLKDMGFAIDKKTQVDSGGIVPYQLAKSNCISLLKWMYDQMNKRLSVRMKSFLNSLLPDFRDKVESTWRFGSYDWSKTKVFFHYEPRINLQGRYPEGIVLPGEEYELLRDELIAKLYECRDSKTGQKVVEKIFKKEDVYHGNHLESAPDIVIHWKEDIVISGLTCTRKDGSTVVSDKIHIRDDRSGQHKPYGIFLAKGKNIKKGLKIRNAEIIDLAPTILYLMGMPVPEDMDGKILTDIFDESYLKENQITYTEDKTDRGKVDSALSNDDEDQLKEHLRALGYLD